MRKTFFLQLILWAMMLVLFSCQKETVKNNSNEQLVSKVNNWLETEKTKLYASKTTNIDVLKKYLDYSNLRIEDSDNGEQIVSIPITKNFDNDKSSIPSLVLLLNNAGNIRKGNIVLFKPKVNGTYTTIPNKVFPGIYSKAEVNVDGQFRFLNVAGRWVYQLDYENGKLKSFGLIKTKENTTSVARTNSDCLDWYLIINWYDWDGNYIGQTHEYVGTTCAGSCGDPMNMTLCPVYEDPGNDDYYEYAVGKEKNWTVYPGPNYTWEVNALDKLKGKRVSSEPQGGHFTNLTNLGVDCINCSSYGVSWNQDHESTTPPGGQTISITVRGHLNTPSNPDIFVDNSNTYNFSSVFP